MKHLVLLVAIVACGKQADQPAPAPAGSAAPSEPGEKKHHEDRHDPAVAAPPLSLAVTIDGSGATWNQDVFDRTPHFVSKNNDGDDRDTWSLRELVHGAAGSNARITTVIGETKETIDAAAWSDPAKTPIVHRTRRGTLKFRWTDADGKWGETGVKEVTGLEISSK